MFLCFTTYKNKMKVQEKGENNKATALTMEKKKKNIFIFQK